MAYGDDKKLPALTQDGFFKDNPEYINFHQCNNCRCTVGVYSTTGQRILHARPMAKNYPWWAACDNTHCPHNDGSGFHDLETPPGWVRRGPAPPAPISEYGWNGY
jgi:hypothetical protein